MIVPSSKQVILTKLSHPHPEIRKEAAREIFKLPRQFDVGCLQAAFITESDPSVVKWLGYCLGRRGDRTSIPILEAKLEKVLPETKEWLFVALHQLRSEGVHPLKLIESSDKVAKLQGLTRAWSVKRVALPQSMLRELLADTDPQIRRWAILTGVKQGWFSNSKRIISFLNDPDFRVREWAAHSLRDFKSDITRTSLMAHTDDKHPRVREWVAKSLAILGGHGVQEVLLHLLQRDADNLVRHGVLKSLGPYLDCCDIKEALLTAVGKEKDTLLLTAAIETASASKNMLWSPEFQEAIASNPAATQSEIVNMALSSAVSDSLSPAQRNAFALLSGLPIFEFILSISRTSKHVPTIKKPLKIGVVIALDEEWKEFLTLFNGVQMVDITDNYICVPTFELDAAPWLKAYPARFVCTVIGDMGLELAQGYSQWLMNRHNLSVLVNIGIAASLDSDCGLADVVIARQVNNYLARVKAAPSGKNGFKFEPSGEPLKPSATAVRFFDGWRHKPSFLQWQKACSNDTNKTLSRPPVPTGGRGKKSNKLVKILDKMRGTPTRLLTGPIASGPIVGASKAFKVWIKSLNRKYLSLDTESAGVVVTEHFSQIPPHIICIRGISDAGDEEKKLLETLFKDAIRGLAMRNATRLLLHCINDLVVSLPMANR